MGKCMKGRMKEDDEDDEGNFLANRSQKVENQRRKVDNTRNIKEIMKAI
jgi:hypothetical protein